MTNMRGFAGPSGGLALQPGVTDTADLYHTSERITAEERAHMKYGHAAEEIQSQNAHKQETKTEYLNYKPQIRLFHIYTVIFYIMFSLSLKPGRGHKDVICFVKIYPYSRARPKQRRIPPAADKTVISPPLRAGSKIST